MLSLLLNGNGTRETATSLIKSRFISMSIPDSEVGVDLASAFLFFAVLELEVEEYDELPPETAILLLALLVPVSITVGGIVEEPATLFGLFPEAPPIGPLLVAAVLLLLLLLVVVLVPKTESELTTMVSVKFDVVNLAIASLDRISLLEPE